MKFNQLRIQQADFTKGKTIPCVQWQIDKRTLVEIRQEPVRKSQSAMSGVIPDMDQPLLDHLCETGMEESVC